VVFQIDVFETTTALIIERVIDTAFIVTIEMNRREQVPWEKFRKQVLDPQAFLSCIIECDVFGFGG